jgi:hypothetical protein
MVGSGSRSISVPERFQDLYLCNTNTLYTLQISLNNVPIYLLMQPFNGLLPLGNLLQAGVDNTIEIAWTDIANTAIPDMIRAVFQEEPNRTLLEKLESTSSQIVWELQRLRHDILELGRKS